VNNSRMKPGNYPRDNISWYQSVAFSRWLNHRLHNWKFPVPNANPLVIGENAEVRLPNEWEWQWAAQGGNEQRQYPWGAWREGYANTDEAGLRQTTAVGMYPQGAAICGALDMSGNLWEWCLNDYSSNNSYKVLRGGAFYYVPGLASAVARHDLRPFDDNDLIGVRVVVSARGDGLAPLISGS
jgi:formylglycine-generating enzyme required for sulfatase activity